ncbi:tyrosine-type recombinase/integrase [Paenibacillus melissococcoides]|uniref:Tyrosine-type recombinase/integrase n=1 Tax=Paenibacillus melissococcoides TaxID=2912268 RepID=A0ABM9GAH8_9BACL|nr:MULTISPECIES: tyrosine-type recombinase/integrase [Paenibacillus]MEB9897216.1 tyrosine-type recombinase/integrase [Bacillus cereus]CAH8248757.1 tyrosine-type recombinase/integrase [Paenibacillus melissococcoides]CAH8713821.1 tyrosine-type recombinase/integrase [Paenibacillus melissococcoides]CAH8720412.1 tyrosine-type recombinase/integrase [Paenibacillus melissococcoides]GIO78438.1 site-specific integrase [Paenibacillus dendritiformis]
MASFQKYKTKDGYKWMYKYYGAVDPLTGKKKPSTKRGFNSKKEAQLDAAIVELQVANGTFVSEKDTTFSEFAPKWLKIYSSTKNVKVSTVQSREVCIRRLLKSFQHIMLKDVTKEMYQNYLISLKESGYSKETITSTHATAKMLFGKAHELDIIKVNPTEGATIPAFTKTVEELEKYEELPKYFEKDELVRFLQTAKEHGMDKDYATFLTLAYTGMRVGELCALKWKDVNFEEKSISITKTYWNKTNNTAKYTLNTPKTTTSKRVILINDMVVEELKKLKALQNIVKMQYRKEYYDGDFIFAKLTKFYGYPEKPKVIEQRLKRLLKISGFSDSLTPHSLRHTHTSLLAEAGVGLTEIMERLGQKDEKITRTVYLHVTKQLKKDAVDKFDKLINSI